MCSPSLHLPLFVFSSPTSARARTPRSRARTRQPAREPALLHLLLVVILSPPRHSLQSAAGCLCRRTRLPPLPPTIDAATPSSASHLATFSFSFFFWWGEGVPHSLPQDTRVDCENRIEDLKEGQDKENDKIPPRYLAP